MAKAKRRRKGAAVLALILWVVTVLATKTHDALTTGIFEIPAIIATIVALVGRSPKLPPGSKRVRAHNTGDPDEHDAPEYEQRETLGQTFMRARREDARAEQDMSDDDQRWREDHGQV